MTRVYCNGWPRVGQTPETRQPALVSPMASRAELGHLLVSVNKIFGAAAPRFSGLKWSRSIRCLGSHDVSERFVMIDASREECGTDSRSMQPGRESHSRLRH